MDTQNTPLLTPNDGLYIKIIGVLSVAIPVVVAFLLFVPQAGLFGSLDVKFLPKLNAMLNSAASLALVTGFYFIKNKNITAHKWSMWSAFLFSSIFLVSYVVYHTQASHTEYGGTGFIKILYFTILISHIILAAAIVPLVLLTIYRSTTNQIAKHKMIARYTFPLWLYVTVTGVIVYFMISPYYAV